MSFSSPADREQFLMHDEQKHEWDIAVKYCKKPNLKDVKVRFGEEKHTPIHRDERFLSISEQLHPRLQDRSPCAADDDESDVCVVGDVCCSNGTAVTSRTSHVRTCRTE